MKLLVGLAFFFVSLLSGINYAAGMDCTMGRGDFIDKILYTCPRPIIDRDSEEYCCYTRDNNVHCCDLPNFLSNTFMLMMPYSMIGLMAAVAVFAICCCCCICCCLCRQRRTRGRVYMVPQTVAVTSTGTNLHPHPPPTPRSRSFLKWCSSERNEASYHTLS